MTNAQTIIGSRDPKGWSLCPTQPPSDLETKAPELWDRLNEERILGPARRYEEADAEAVAAQRRFKTAARRAIKAVLGATALATAITAAGVLYKQLGGWGSTIVIGCGVLGALVGRWLRCGSVESSRRICWPNG